jgi:Protein of unknown function (DUF2934)
MAKNPTREEIQLRAYEIYLEGGCEEGRDLENWLAAEKELADRAQGATVAGSSTKKSAAAVVGQQRSVASSRDQI